VFLAVSENIKESVENALVTRLPCADYYVECNGKIVADEDLVQDGQCYHVQLRLRGGKGGFGSMLRALGAQIEKTTNREACRDLSGRRMRDINNEKKLREWAAKASEREKAKEERRRERRERLKAGAARHKFDDPQFDRQKADIAERLDDALDEGLQKAGPSCSVLHASSSLGARLKKRKAAAAETITDPKKARDWIGLDDVDLGLLSSSSDGEGDIVMQDVEKPTAVSGDGSDSCGACSSSSSEGMAPPVASTTGMEESKDESCLPNRGLSGTDGGGCGSLEANGAVQPEDAVQKNEDKSVIVAAASTVPSDEKMVITEQAASQMSAISSNETVNLDEHESIESLQQLGLDVLKAALMARGLKCGGTLEQRAQRLFAVKGLSVDQIDPSLFARPLKKK
jgi:hypothetical protein